MKLVSEKFGDGSEAVCSISNVIENHCTKTHIFWPQQAIITVLYCNNVFGDELSKWNKSAMFQDLSYVQVENGSRYARKQWYAQPTTIASQVILDRHHILVNN